MKRHLSHASRTLVILTSMGMVFTALPVSARAVDAGTIRPTAADQEGATGESSVSSPGAVPTTAAPTITGTATKPVSGKVAALRNERAKIHLEAAKVAVCKTKETILKKRSASMVERAQKMEANFTEILSRVETYYTETLVPQGKTLGTYDSLSADSAAKKSAVDAALADAQANLGDFSCEGNGPKEAMQGYRTDMQAVNTALHAYRTSIKNMTRALRQVAGVTQESPAPSPTAE